MKNAINCFKGVRPFYKGKSILVSEQIVDLRNVAENVHKQVMKVLTHVPADHIYSYGENFKK